MEKSDMLESYNLARERSNTWPSSTGQSVPLQRHFISDSYKYANDPYSHFIYSPSFSSLNSSHSTLGLSLITESNESLASGGSSTRTTSTDERAPISVTSLHTHWTPLNQRTSFQADSATVGRPVSLSQQPMTYRSGHPSYVELITQAILASPEQRMTLAEIYDWMVNNVDAFKNQRNLHSSTGWKNSVRHNLSLHSRFKRVKRNGMDKPSWWTVDLNEEAKRYRTSAGGGSRNHKHLKALPVQSANSARSSLTNEQSSKEHNPSAITVTTTSPDSFSPSSRVSCSSAGNFCSSSLGEDDYLNSTVCAQSSDNFSSQPTDVQSSLRDLLSSSFKINNTTDHYQNDDHYATSLTSGLAQAITAGLRTDCSQYNNNFWPYCNPLAFTPYAQDTVEDMKRCVLQQTAQSQQTQPVKQEQNLCILYDDSRITSDVQNTQKNGEQTLRVKMLSGNEQRVSIPSPVQVNIVVQDEKQCQTEADDLDRNLRRQLLINNGITKNAPGNSPTQFFSDTKTPDNLDPLLSGSAGTRAFMTDYNPLTFNVTAVDSMAAQRGQPQLGNLWTTWLSSVDDALEYSNNIA